MKLIERIKRFVIKCLKGLLVIGLILMPSLYFGVKEKPTEMGISIVAGCLTCVFLNLDKFIEFKGAGFTAKLKQTVLEAEITINELRRIIKPITLFSYHSLTHAGRLGSGRENQDQLANSIYDVVCSLSIQNDLELRQARAEYWRYNIWDKYGEFVHSFHSSYDNRIKSVEQDIFNELDKIIDRNKNSFPSLSDINDIFSKYNFVMSPTDKSNLDNYLNYCKDKIKNIDN